jgi:hypothetical protein
MSCDAMGTFPTRSAYISLGRTLQSCYERDLVKRNQNPMFEDKERAVSLFPKYVELCAPWWNS